VVVKSRRDAFDSDFDESVFVPSDNDEQKQLLSSESQEVFDKRYWAEKDLKNQQLLAEKEAAQLARQNASFNLAVATLCNQLIQLASKHLDNPSHPVWKELLKKLFDEETSAVALITVEKTNNFPVKEKVIGILKNYHQQFADAIKSYAEDSNHNPGIAGELRRSLVVEDESLRGYQKSIKNAYKKLDSPTINGYLKSQIGPATKLEVVGAVLRSLFTRGLTKTFNDLENVKKNRGSYLFFGTASQNLMNHQRKVGKVVDSKVTVYKTIKV
jgi:hypothetical protein